MRKLVPRFLVIDDFLPADDAKSMLSHALAKADKFAAATVSSHGVLNQDWRRSRQLVERPGRPQKLLEDAIRAQFDEILAGTGVNSFPIASVETQIVVHGDGDFYNQHIDTRAGDERDPAVGDRIVSAVYYFNREPKRFTGGELAIFAFGDDEPAELIEPAHNRLVAFASFVQHAVLPVSCPSADFEDGRFSMNCWIRRARPD